MKLSLAAVKSAVFDNPVVGRELLTGLTGPKLGLVFSLVTVVYLITDLTCFVVFWETSYGRPMPFQAGAFLHLWHVVVGYGALALLLPIRVAGYIEGPRMGRAFDQIVVTGISPLRVCLGNWLVGFFYATVLLAITLPYEFLAYLFGGVSVGQILAAYGTLLIYSNVIIWITMGLAVVDREWLTVPVAIAIVCTLGILSAIPMLPSVVTAIGPLHLVMQQFLEGFEAIRSEIPSTFNQDPRIFFAEVPLWLYTLFTWSALVLPFFVLVLLGPAHRFTPGLNVFGAAVLPGDRRRRFFRRIRYALARRVEMAFYYENRPDWCRRWDFSARTFTGLFLVVFLWAVTLGVAFSVNWSEGTFEHDEVFHISFFICCLILFLWMLSLGQSSLRSRWRERIGRLEVSRGSVYDICFVLLLGALLGAYMAWLRHVENLFPVPRGSWRGARYDFGRYASEWWLYVSACLIFFSNLYLGGRVLSFLVRSVGFWRGLLVLYTLVVLIAPPLLYVAIDELGVLSESLSFLCFLCPFSLFYMEPLPMAESFARFVSVHIGLAVILVSAIIVLWTLFRKGATGESDGSSKRALVTDGSRVVAVLLVLLVPAQVDARDGFGWSVEGELEEVLTISDVRRGFDGTVFADGVDFCTILVENKSERKVSGEILPYTPDPGGVPAGQPIPFEVGARTATAIRIGLNDAGEGYDSSTVLELRFESSAGRLRVQEITPLQQLNQAATRGGLLSPPSFLLVNEDGRMPIAWQREMTGKNLEFVACSPMSLPESPRSYSGVSVVFLGPTDLLRWSRAQRRALYDYVRLGGSVIFCGAQNLQSLAASGVWGSIFEGTEMRLHRGAGFDAHLLTFAEEVGAFHVAAGGGEQVPILSVRSLGPGRIGHLAFDPANPQLPASALSSTRFWSEFTDAIPRGVYPMALSGRRYRSRHLQDTSSMVTIVGYFAVYTILLGPGLFFGFRKRSRRSWMWVYVAGLTAVFTVGTSTLDWGIHLSPSYCEERQLTYFGPGAREGVVLSGLHLRSSGKQRHRLRVVGDTVSSFEVRHSYYYYRQVLPWRWREVPSLADELHNVQLHVTPWGAQVYHLLGNARRSQPTTGRAALDTKRNTLAVWFDGPARGEATVLTYNPLGQGSLHGNQVEFDRLRRPAGSGELVLTQENRPQHEAARVKVPGDLESYLAMTSGGQPRVMVVWGLKEETGELVIESDDIAFRREVPEDSRRRQRSQLIEEDGKLYRSFRQRLVVVELPVDVK